MRCCTSRDAHARAGPCLLLVAIALVLASLASPAHSAIIAWWPADDATGTTLHDVSGRDMHGTTSRTDCWVVGRCVGAIDVDPSSDIVRDIAPEFDDPIGPEFTVTAFLNWHGEHPGTYSPYSYILDARDYDYERAGFIFFLVTDGRVVLQVGSPGGPRQFASAHVVPPNAWTHVAATVSTSAAIDTVRIYINGVLDSLCTRDDLAYAGTTVPAALGNNRWEDGQDAPFNGLLDEVRVDDVALSAAKIAQLAVECQPHGEVAVGGALDRADVLRAESSAHGSRIACHFTLRDGAMVHLDVVDAAGRTVRTLLHDAARPAGTHVTSWNVRDTAGRPAAHGVYFVRLRAGAVHATTRACVLP